MAGTDEDVLILNAVDAHTMRMPRLGMVRAPDGSQVVGIRTGDSAICMPGDRALDFALAVCELVIEQTASIDATTLADLTQRAEDVAAALRGLRAAGKTHDAADAPALMQ